MAGLSCAQGVEDQHFKEGMEFFKNGNYEEAIDDFQKSWASNPNVADTYFYEGSAYAAIGSLDNALSDMNKAIAIDPKYTKAYDLRAKILDRIKAAKA